MRDALTQRRATELRNRLTDAEQALWKRLRRRQVDGLRFRRQVPIGPFIADFACLDGKLIVEVDGGQHAGSDRDVHRDDYLRKQGYRVIRIWNHDALNHIDAVMESIYRELKMPPP